MTLNEIGRFFERIEPECKDGTTQTMHQSNCHWIEMIDQEPTEAIRTLMGRYLFLAELLGKRTAEMHLALASAVNTPSFTAEPFTPFYQRGLFQSMRNHGLRVLKLLDRKLPSLSPSIRTEAEKVVGFQAEIIKRFRRITERNITALRIRCHGDYHLGQVLYTGKDFFIIDFEGEPMRAISERQIKRSPLRDVAGMIRSFHYASLTGLLQETAGIGVRQQHAEAFKPWARLWYQWTSAEFLKAYLKQVDGAPFLPQGRGELRCLLETYLMEKALYELDYEMNSRPDWLAIPLQGILELLNPTESLTKN